MKKIIFTMILLLFSFSLRAEGDNSLVIGIGKASSTVKISTRSESLTETKYNSFKEEPAFDAKMNLSIGYLKQISGFDNRLSLGADFTIFMSNGFKNKEEQTILPDSSSVILKDNSSLYSSTILMLINYELLKINKFDISAQLGGGFILNVLNLDFNTTFYNPQREKKSYVHISGRGVAGTGAVRAGLVGNYNMYDRLAIGVGAYYTYAGETTRDNIADSGTDYKIKNDGIVNYNVHLVWKF